MPGLRRRIEQSIEEHRQMVEALGAKNVSQLEKLM